MSEIVFPSNINYNTKILNISSNNLKGILNLKKFTELEELYCANNEITQIINIPCGFRYLNCSHNKISILDNLSNGMKGINIKKNKITKLYYNFKIKPKKYPKTLKTISYAYHFDQPINNLPKSTKKICINANFVQTIDNLPPHLIELKIDGYFNQEINNLPVGLMYLFLGMEFNKSTNNLPGSLLYLKLGLDFDQSLDNLPNSLKYLILNNHIYNSYSFINNLPNNLKYLKLSGGSDNDIVTDKNKLIYLPSQLEFLILELGKFKNSIKCPNTLKQITISKYYMINLFDEYNKLKITEYIFSKHDNLAYLPKTINHLIIKSINSNNSNNSNNFENMLKLTPNITKLTFNFHSEIYQISENNKHYKLPNTIKSIHICDNGMFQNKKISCINDNIEEIILESYTQINYIPKKFHKLVKFQKFLQNVIY